MHFTDDVPVMVDGQEWTPRTSWRLPDDLAADIMTDATLLWDKWAFVAGHDLFGDRSASMLAVLNTEAYTFHRTLVREARLHGAGYRNPYRQGGRLDHPILCPTRWVHRFLTLDREYDMGWYWGTWMRHDGSGVAGRPVYALMLGKGV